MNIPDTLLNNILERKVVLFFGAGVTRDARSNDGSKPPLSSDLAKMLSTRFLSGKYNTSNLATVAGLAISEHDLISVQEYIREIFKSFMPAKCHLLLPEIPWKAIFTINYDLIIENAYDECKKSVQKLAVFKKDGERVEELLIDESYLMYVKLHGCIDNIYDINTPLILDHDQYANYENNRNSLFTKLEEHGRRYPIVFIGSSLDDSDIRIFLNRMDRMAISRPRYYYVAPNISEEVVRYWESKRVTTINATFGNFMIALNHEISDANKSLLTKVIEVDHPIKRRYRGGTDLAHSDMINILLNRDFEFVHASMNKETVSPKDFYRGYSNNWAPIECNLDVKRDLAYRIETDIFLDAEDICSYNQQLILIQGYAGSGKSILLRRMAWDGAVAYDVLCLYLRNDASPDYKAIKELYELCGDRIYLFIDSASTWMDTISSILKAAIQDDLPITIFATDRYNELNDKRDMINSMVTKSYDLEYLSRSEITELLKLLETHNSLGYLSSLATEERYKELESRSGRQLLVALHEATLGKPFSDIILDEYNSITNESAKKVYLTICVLHRLNVEVRAGFISRVHNIAFDEFETCIFKPLESIIYSIYSRKTGDINYVARHPHIANEVFERVLIDQDDKYDQLEKILLTLDLDYSSDYKAFRGLIKAAAIRDMFPNDDNSEKLYFSLEESYRNSDYYWQQRAIFEMKRKNKNFDKALTHIKRAKSLAPRNSTIDHTMSEIYFWRSELERDLHTRESYRHKSKKMVKDMIRSNPDDLYSTHTLLKILLSQFEQALKVNDETIDVNEIAKEIERVLFDTLQKHRDEEFIKDFESKYYQLMNDYPSAIKSMESAFYGNPRNQYNAIRLAKLYRSAGKEEQAVVTLRACVDHNPLAKDAFYQLALYLCERKHETLEILHLLRNSFVKGDKRYDAQFLYARFLYQDNKIDEAQEIFDNLKIQRLDQSIAKKARFPLKNTTNIIFTGKVKSLGGSYGYITRDAFGDSIYITMKYVDHLVFDKLYINAKVSFEIWFNYHGPLARNISIL